MIRANSAAKSFYASLSQQRDPSIIKSQVWHQPSFLSKQEDALGHEREYEVIPDEHDFDEESDVVPIYLHLHSNFIQ